MNQFPHNTASQSLASSVSSADPEPLRLLDPKSDVVFKKIFGQHPDLIKSFLNGILPLPEGHEIVDITYLAPEQSPRIPSLKNTIVDVKCVDQQGHIFIVEMQMSWSKSFLKRFLFGASKAYVQQLGAGQAYHTLCPVYGVAIVNETFDPPTEDWFHHYKLLNVKDHDKDLEGIELIFVELPKFKPQTFHHRKMGVLWLRFLREMTGAVTSVPQEFQENPDIAKALELTHESSFSRAELAAYDDYLDTLRVEETIRHDAFDEGKEEGRLEGERKAQLVMAKKMLATGIDKATALQITGLAAADMEALPKK